MTAASPMGDKTASEAKKGDLAMADGTFISYTKIATLTDAQKANVAGIVFWTTADSNTSGNTPARLTDDEIMKEDFPYCTHGLIVSLKKFSQNSTNWQSSYSSIASWQSSTAFNPDNKDKYKSIASSVKPDAPINYILGYQNTKILKSYNEQCEDSYKVLPVSLLASWVLTNPAPANTTGWFFPSFKELTLLCGDDKDVCVTMNILNDEFGTSTWTKMNSILTSIRESLGTGYAEILAAGGFNSSSEKSYSHKFYVTLGNGFGNYHQKNQICYVRAVCAY